jgi:hypothetical protein
MKRLILAVAAATSLATPLPAQTLSVLLPVISFPDTVVNPSTKGCVTPSDAVCILQE